MEKNILFNRGGNGGVTGRVAIPKDFLEVLGVTKEDNKVNITLKGKKIIIEKIGEGKRMNKIVKMAKQLDNYNQYIPELEVGEIVELNDVWDGNGEVPENSYSYTLTCNGIDGKSNYEVCINYEFEVVKEAKNPLDTEIRITSIELI